MASKQKGQPDLVQLLREFDNAFVELRPQAAGRNAAEVLYDDCVLVLMARGCAVEWAVLGANQLYPSEALEVTAETIDSLERHYHELQRVSILDYVREKSATPRQNQLSA